MKSIVSAICLLFSITAFAGTPCEEEAAMTLEEMEIEGTLHSTDKTKVNPKSGLVSSYIHWFRSPQCKEGGYVVVRTTRSCRTFSVYTQSGCKIKGLPAYW